MAEYVIVGGRPRHPRWQKFAKWFITEVESECRCCGSKNDLQVHHKLPYHQFPELELVKENCMTACERCHFVICHANNWSNWVEEVEFEASRHRALVEHCRKKRDPRMTVVMPRKGIWDRLKEWFCGV